MSRQQIIPMEEKRRNNRVKELWQKKIGFNKQNVSTVESKEVRTKHQQDRADRNFALYSEQKKFEDARANYRKK